MKFVGNIVRTSVIFIALEKNFGIDDVFVRCAVCTILPRSTWPFAAVKILLGQYVVLKDLETGTGWEKNKTRGDFVIIYLHVVPYRAINCSVECIGEFTFERWCVLSGKKIGVWVLGWKFTSLHSGVRNTFRGSTSIWDVISCVRIGSPPPYSCVC